MDEKLIISSRSDYDRGEEGDVESEGNVPRKKLVMVLRPPPCQHPHVLLRLQHCMYETLMSSSNSKSFNISQGG